MPATGVKLHTESADNPSDLLPRTEALWATVALRSEDRPKPDPLRKQPDRADWLVGAEEGMSAEVSRSQAGMPSPFVPPKLVRPDSGETVAPRPGEVRPPFQAPPLPGASRVPLPISQPTPAMPRWDPVQSSVPTLKRDREREVPPASSSPIPELTRDFPMDDAEERAVMAAEQAERRAQDEAIAAGPHAVVRPAEFEIPVIPPSGLPKLQTVLATDRRVQAAVLVVVAIVLAMTFWPREEKTISVAHLKSEPERFADTQVRVSGKVVEIYPVGSSWAYALVQGRDTIVVFTRMGSPTLHEKRVVVGTLSNGYLDGTSRAAIFETNR